MNIEIAAISQEINIEIHEVWVKIEINVILIIKHFEIDAVCITFILN